MIKLKQQLTLFYRSRSIFNSYMIKSKHILLYLIILMLATFIFNKNIDSNSNSPKFNHFIYPEDANLDKFKDLFTKPKPK
jgi:hypothetical protein